MRVVGVVAAGSVLTVSALILKRERADPEPWKCFRDTATSYKGVVDSSNDGRKCMNWGEAGEHEQLSALFGSLTGGASAEKLNGNFCRAFTSADAKPWCFVVGFADPNAAKQDCDVPQCPTGGPWSTDYKTEAVNAIVPCTDAKGVPTKDCDCSCAGAGGRSFIEIAHPKTGKAVTCHC